MPNTNYWKLNSVPLQGVCALAAAIVIILVGVLVGISDFFVMMTRLVALVLLIYAFLCLMIQIKWLPKLAAVLRLLWIAAALVMILSFIVIEIVIFSGSKSDVSDPDNLPSHFMIILGAGVDGTTPSDALTSRLDAALPYLLANPTLICVVAGGQGPREDITEAQAMYSYLVARGVSPTQLLQETRSTNTAQNIAYSMKLLDTYVQVHGLSPIQGQDVVVCSNGYHLLRARYLLRRGGMVPHGLSAPMPSSVMYYSGYFREYFSVLFMWRKE